MSRPDLFSVRGFDSPAAISFDSDGYFYILEESARRFQKFKPGSLDQFSYSILEGKSENEVYSFRDMAIDTITDNIYITNNRQQRIDVYTIVSE